MAIAPSFGAIQLEDIAAPECFEIEQALVERLSMPVLHDDQHGTAVVALAALLNGARRVGRPLRDSVVGQSGSAPRGSASRGCSRRTASRACSARTARGCAAAVRAAGWRARRAAGTHGRADVVIATTGVRGLIKPEWVRRGQMILALSNPDAEIEPLVALERGAAFAADGKSINNVSGFPGVVQGRDRGRRAAFHGRHADGCRRGLAQLAGPEELLPDPLDLETHKAVTAAVRAAAIEPVSAAL